jgi:hypothetical protein
MDIFQGTISSEYQCRPFLDGGKPAGLLFYKKDSVSNQLLFVLIGSLILFVDLAIWYKLGFEYFLIALLASLAGFILYAISGRQQDQKSGVKYSLDEIQEVKILDTDMAMSYQKSGASSVAGALVGGALLGGAGAVVGSVAAGNKTHKEQVVRIGVKFHDSNWVVLQANIDDSMMIGQVNKSNMEILLQMTSMKQVAPF